MVASFPPASPLIPSSATARLCPSFGLILPLLPLVLGGCATSADRNTEAMRELAALQAKQGGPRTPGGARECKPGTEGPCFDGAPAAAGRGICRDGTRVCNERGLWGPCKGQVLPKALELCNGLDDDCNGIIDDGFPRIGTACSVGEGQCRSQGVYQCRADGTSAHCSAHRKKPSPEICDGIDNDCDGLIDETDPQARTERCRTGKSGACAEGRRQCVQGILQCVPLHTPTHEVCNGRDDDCNGKVDDQCSAT